MDNTLAFVNEGIIRDMSEGIIYIGFDGVIRSVNPASLKILEKSEGELTGRTFASCFFDYEENDAFNQAILNAVYDREVAHEDFVPYFTGEKTKQIHITTSFLHNGGEKIGIIAVLSDITELSELRDALLAMERIKELNGKLEIRNRLLSETFGRFLSDEIVHELLETPDGLSLGGKKRTLTVMMSDLRGFTALSEIMNAQDLISMLNHYLGEMTDVIQSNGGTIIEFIGDGIMAVFGAPAELENHAAAAVRAAVLMQKRMPEINKWNTEHGYPALEMGIGINTGGVIVGNIGSEKRTKYGVVGNHVNICGRIESYTVGGQVLISPATKEMAGAGLRIESEAEVYPKGAKTPLVISCVSGIGDVFYKAPYDEPEPLLKPFTISFVPVSGKHTTDDVYKGVILAVSEYGAVMRTEAKLSVYDNIQIDIGAKLFAKVTSAGDSFVLRFTSKPVRFDEWLKNLKAGVETDVF